MVVPVDPQLHGIELLLDAERRTELVVEVHDPGPAQNYLPRHHVLTETVTVPAGQDQWVRVELPWQPDHPRNAFLIIRANADLRVHTGDEPLPGVVSLTHRHMPTDEKYPEQWRAWKQVLLRTAPSVRLLGQTAAFDAERAVGGYARPYGGPQMWISAEMDTDPAPWLELVWDEAVQVGEVAVIFDDDLEEDLINLHHHRTPFEVLPTLVRDYRIEARADDEQQWTVLTDVRDNRHRHRRHRLPDTTRMSALRVVVTATNGVRAARVVSLRAWAPQE